MSSHLCPVCRSSARPFLRGRVDREYAVKQQLDYHRCVSCGLAFADPIPDPATIGTFYVDYSTHGTPTARRAGVLARWARRKSLREFEAASTAGKSEAVLDYGCGDGSFLAELAQAGYANVVGYDFDPSARESARMSGAKIVDSDDKLAGAGPFATITLNHVIEHVEDPVADLERLAMMLRPGGRIIMRTPNARSVLCRLLGDRWRGWETPRHLHVFTPEAFRRLAIRSDATQLVDLSTSQAMYLGIFHESLASSVGRLARHGLALVSLVVLSVVARVAPVGEELVVVFERRPVPA